MTWSRTLLAKWWTKNSAARSAMSHPVPVTIATTATRSRILRSAAVASCVTAHTIPSRRVQAELF